MNTIIKRTKVRHTILIFLFLATVFNYADRATLSVVAPIMSKELGFDPEAMGPPSPHLVSPMSLCNYPVVGY